jgi:hypothetical protein
MRDEELPPELSGEERLDMAVQQMRRREQWRSAQQAKRERDAAEAEAKRKEAEERKAAKEKEKVAAGRQTAREAEPMLQQQVAQRFMRPESTAPVVMGMNSLLEAKADVRDLLREAEDAPALPPAPSGEGDVDQLPAPESDGDGEVVSLLRQILAAVERLAGDEAPPSPDGEDADAPVIPSDAEAVENV